MKSGTLLFPEKKTLTGDATAFTFDLVTLEQHTSISRLGRMAQAVVCVLDPSTPTATYSRAWKAFAKLGTNQEGG